MLQGFLYCLFINNFPVFEHRSRNIELLCRDNCLELLGKGRYRFGPTGPNIAVIMGLQITTLIFCEHEEVVFTGGQHHRQYERVLGVHVNQIPIHEHWFGVL